MISPSLFVLFFFSLFFFLNASNVWDIGELHQARKTIKYDMYKLVLYLNLYSAIWSSSDRGWWWLTGGMKELGSSHNHANHRMYPPSTCFHPFCICFCVPKDNNYAAGWQVLASAHLWVFFAPPPFFPCDSVILKCICLRRKLLLLLLLLW